MSCIWLQNVVASLDWFVHLSLYYHHCSITNLNSCVGQTERSLVIWNCIITRVCISLIPVLLESYTLHVHSLWKIWMCIHTSSWSFLSFKDVQKLDLFSLIWSRGPLLPLGKWMQLFSVLFISLLPCCSMYYTIKFNYPLDGRNSTICS